MSKEFDPEKLSVVFVDDDKLLVDLFRMLAGEIHPGWEIQCFSDPMRALAYVKGYGSRIDVMVCDVNMPFVSGLQLFEIIRLKYPLIIKITLSGNIDSRTIMDSVKIAEYNLCKPIKGEALCGKIVELARLRHEGAI